MKLSKTNKRIEKSTFSVRILAAFVQKRGLSLYIASHIPIMPYTLNLNQYELIRTQNTSTKNIVASCVSNISPSHTDIHIINALHVRKILEQKMKIRPHNTFFYFPSEMAQAHLQRSGVEP